MCYVLTFLIRNGIEEIVKRPSSRHYQQVIKDKSYLDLIFSHGFFDTLYISIITMAPIVALSHSAGY